MEQLLIKNGRVIDPFQKLDETRDLLIQNGRVAETAPPGKIKSQGMAEIDATNLVVAPGFVDLHCHLREPGFEHKETIYSGTLSAVAGGFTSVCCMANTDPVDDNASVAGFINKRIAETANCHVYPVGAVTKGLEGKEIAGCGELKEAGCVALSDDGHTIKSAAIMKLALSYARGFGMTVTVHDIDPDLSKNGQMNSSIMSTRLGLSGIPNAAEEIMIARDLILAEMTGSRLHVAHVSTRRAVEMIAEARQRGVAVTCEVTPHHLSLTDESLAGYDTDYKMMPPLRRPEDVAGLKKALRQGGIIDAIATDHAPHGIVEKELEFDKAAFGIIGFETALPLALNLVREGVISLNAMIELLTSGPARVYGLKAGTLAKGSCADIVLFDPAKKWTLTPDAVFSKSQNTPWMGRELTGRVVKTIVCGKVRFDCERGVV